jgi:hypothetical protein
MENPEVLNQVLLFTTILSPILTALVGVIKTTVKVPDNYLPAISIVVGLVIGLAAQSFTDLDMVSRLWSGLLAGLGGTGLYEVFKNRTGTSKTEGK